CGCGRTTVSPVEVLPVPHFMRLMSTPTRTRRSAAIFPRGSPPIFDIKPTRVPRTHKLCAKIADELPSVNAKPLAKCSRSSTSSLGNPYRMRSRLSSPTTQTSIIRVSLSHVLMRSRNLRSGMNANVLHDAAYGAVWTWTVGPQVPPQREEKTQQLSEDHAQRRAVIVRHIQGRDRRERVLRERA